MHVAHLNKTHRRYHTQSKTIHTYLPDSHISIGVNQSDAHHRRRGGRGGLGAEGVRAEPAGPGDDVHDDPLVDSALVTSAKVTGQIDAVPEDSVGVPGVRDKLDLEIVWKELIDWLMDKIDQIYGCVRLT